MAQPLPASPPVAWESAPSPAPNFDFVQQPTKPSKKPPKANYFSTALTVACCILVAILVLVFALSRRGRDVAEADASKAGRDSPGRPTIVPDVAKPGSKGESDVGQKGTPDVGQKDTPDVGQKDTPDVGQKDTPDVGQKDTPDVGQKDTPDVRAKGHAGRSAKRTRRNVGQKDTPDIDQKDTRDVDQKGEPNKPGTQTQKKPAPVADPPEKVAVRVKDAFARAKTPADFQAVAADALKLIEQASDVGEQEVAKGIVTLALVAARKADDDELAKRATIYVLEPGAKPSESAHEPFVGSKNAKVYLDDLEESDVRVGFGGAGKHGRGTDQSTQCRVNGVAPAHSLVPHPFSDGESSVSYQLDDQFRRFHSTVAVQDDHHPGTPMTFRVRGDGKVLWESGPIRPKMTEECNIPVEGVRVLSLEVSCPGSAFDANIIWCDPVLIRRPSHPSGRRATVPDAAAQEHAMNTFREVYAAQSSSATTSEKQKALSQEILEKAQSTENDAPSQYVMLKEAGRFAVQAKDADLAFQVVEEMGARFAIDAFDLKTKAVTAICKSHMLPEEGGAAVGKALALMEEAVMNEQLDAAKQLGAMATNLARRSKDAAFIKETVVRQRAIAKGMAEVKKAQAELGGAVDALEKNPTDPAANLAVGSYRCFIRNQWSKGVPMLALGNNPALKNLAAKELKGVTDAGEQAKLGDAWWDLGEKKGEFAQKNLRERAKHWYRQAAPGLTGLAKEQATKRLAESSVPPPPVTPTPKPGPGRLRFRGQVVAFDPRANTITLAYDFRNKKQLEDFDLKGSDAVLGGGALQLAAGKSLQHRAAFKTVIVRGVLTAKPDGNFLTTGSGIFAHTEVYAAGDVGSQRANYGVGHPDGGSSTGGSMIPPITFNFVATPDKIRLQWLTAADPVRHYRTRHGNGFGLLPGAPEGVSFDPRLSDFPVGHVELQGGKSGLTLSELWISGELDAKQ